jgi:hypothetical protein
VKLFKALDKLAVVEHPVPVRIVLPERVFLISEVPL